MAKRTWWTSLADSEGLQTGIKKLTDVYVCVSASSLSLHEPNIWPNPFPYLKDTFGQKGEHISNWQSHGSEVTGGCFKKEHRSEDKDPALSSIQSLRLELTGPGSNRLRCKWVRWAHKKWKEPTVTSRIKYQTQEKGTDLKLSPYTGSLDLTSSNLLWTKQMLAVQCETDKDI